MIISWLIILENSSPKILLISGLISGLLIQTRSAFLSTQLYCDCFLFLRINLLSESEVFDLITASSKKSCPLDPIPTKLLNECVHVLLPPITKRINLSLDSGYFPRTWKCALVRPPLIKDGLPLVFKNFRPVSNLAFISKLVETVVAKQLQHYLNCNNLFRVPISLSTKPQHRNCTA